MSACIPCSRNREAAVLSPLLRREWRREGWGWSSVSLGCSSFVAQGLNWSSNAFWKHPALLRHTGTKTKEMEAMGFPEEGMWPEDVCLSVRICGRAGAWALLLRFLTQHLNYRNTVGFFLSFSSYIWSCAMSFTEVIKAPFFYDLIFSCATTTRLTAKNCGEKRKKD